MAEKLEVQKNVERPAHLGARSNGQEKYPFEDLKEKNDFILVPWYWYFGEDADKEDPALRARWDGDGSKENPGLASKHRDRVQNAARGHALKVNKQAAKEPDYNAAEYKPVRFTVGQLENGIGVWRD
jgi:hypothetical protein